jgi:hypothetical protein
MDLSPADERADVLYDLHGEQAVAVSFVVSIFGLFDLFFHA